MTQTIPSSPINTRARSNFAARYVREHYLNRCCFECLVAEQEVRIEGTRVNTQANRHRPCDPISWNRNLCLSSLYIFVWILLSLRIVRGSTISFRDIHCRCLSRSMLRTKYKLRKEYLKVFLDSCKFIFFLNFVEYSYEM